jgi:PIN domain nuclease of toxin-antitoxin system
MQVLIDTHILLWLIFDSKKLDRERRSLLADTSNTVYVSVVSLWELSLKYALGKLKHSNTDPSKFPTLVEQMGFEFLPLSILETSTFFRLTPLGHKDPFDRMLLWQALKRKLAFMTSDHRLSDYQVLGVQLI